MFILTWRHTHLNSACVGRKRIYMSKTALGIWYLYPQEFKTFSFLETFSLVVQRSAVHLYTPSPCTGFIGNSCVFCFNYNALFQWEFGCWHDTFGFQWENVCLGLCAMCTLDFLHTVSSCVMVIRIPLPTGESVISHNSGVT